MSATMKDIAQKSGLSLGTVSKYFNGGSLRPQNRAQIEAAVQALDYTPNLTARNLKTKQTKTVGVMLPELGSAFMSDIVAHIEDTLRRSDYGIIVCDYRCDETLECDIVSFLLHKQVDGIFSVPMRADGTQFAPALKKNVPIVLIDRLLKPLNGLVSAVVINNQIISRHAICALLDAGHRRIGLLAGKRSLSTTIDRLQGYKDALCERGIPLNPELIAYGDYTMSGGFLAAEQLLALPDQPTALFCTNYEMTLGARIALNKAGLSVPHDVSLIGFDDMDMTKAIFPDTTLVVQPMRALSDHAAEQMLSLLSARETQHKVITLPATLKFGETIAPPTHNPAR